VLERAAQVWEAAPGRSHPLLEPGKAGHLAWDGVVVHHVGGEQGIQGVEVACIDRLDDAAVGDFMLLRGHPRSPLSAPGHDGLDPRLWTRPSDSFRRS